MKKIFVLIIALVFNACVNSDDDKEGEVVKRNLVFNTKITIPMERNIEVNVPAWLHVDGKDLYYIFEGYESGDYKTLGYYVCVSSDGGKNWLQPRTFMDEKFNYGWVYGRKVWMFSGSGKRIIAVIVDDDKNFYCSVTDDGGRNWEKSKIDFEGNAGDLYINNAKMDAEGEINLVVTQKGEHKILRSSGGVDKWEKKSTAELYEFGGFDDFFIHKDGEVSQLLVEAEYKGLPTGYIPRLIKIKSTEGKGRSWSDFLTVSVKAKFQAGVIYKVEGQLNYLYTGEDHAGLYNYSADSLSWVYKHDMSCDAFKTYVHGNVVTFLCNEGVSYVLKRIESNSSTFFDIVDMSFIKKNTIDPGFMKVRFDNAGDAYVIWVGMDYGTSTATLNYASTRE